VWSRNIKNGCSIHIYDISRLRVNVIKIYISNLKYPCHSLRGTYAFSCLFVDYWRWKSLGRWAQCLWEVVPDLSKNDSVSPSGTNVLLKIKALWSFETSVSARSILRRHIPGDLDLQQHRYENYKSPSVDYWSVISQILLWGRSDPCDFEWWFKQKKEVTSHVALFVNK